MTKTLNAVTSAACWQTYLAPSTALGTSGLAMTAPMSVAAAFSAAPFAMLGTSAAAATTHVEAVAGVVKTATAPKQADKQPTVTRNDVNPDRLRPGAPPS